MSEMNAADVMDHLCDGAPVVAPLALVGHHRPDDPRASLPVARYFPDRGAVVHPYNGQPTVAVEDDAGRLVFVAVTRLAHERGCPVCAPVWQRFDALAAELPDDGSMLTAAIPFAEGGALLLVDAVDVAESSDEEG